MAIRSRDESNRILGPFLRRVAQCIERAWKDLEEQIPPSLRAEMSPRTRAAFLNDRIKWHARREFQDDPSVGFIRGRGGLMVLAICGAFLLRFKKLRTNLKTSNIPTQQSLAFSQQMELELPGAPPAMTHVNAGYILNRMQTQIAATYVTCPVGKRIEWSIDLAAIPFGDVLNMPSRSEQPKVGTTIVGKTGEKAPQRTVENRKGDDDDDDSDSER